MVDEKDICTKCKGKKIFQNSKNLECVVEPGCPHEHDYIFHGMGDEAPGIISYNIGIMGGDIHVRIFIQKHHLFERKGADIFIEK